MVRLRARLAKSQNVFGRGLLNLLASDKLDEDTWEEIEDTLITADVGVTSATQITEGLRTRCVCSAPAVSTKSVPCCEKNCSPTSTRSWTVPSAPKAGGASRRDHGGGRERGR